MLSSQKTERIYSLDSLRAIMMLLGIVLHSALTYNVTNHDNVWGIKDPNSTHIITDFIVLLIHSFRMPIFFLIAGFFGAMLFYERNPIQMIKNRISRIVYPFIIFVFILSPLIYISFNFSGAVFNEIQNPLKKVLELFSNTQSFIPKTTAHLWFLYYLILITLTTVVLALLLKKAKRFTQKITLAFEWLFKKPIIRVLFFSGLTFLLLTLLGVSMIDGSVSLIPNINTFSFYFFFYVIGWVLFKSKHLLQEMVKYDWLCTILAIALIIIQGVIIQYSNLGLTPGSDSAILISFNAVIVWLFVFGISGLFIRYGSSYSKRMRYISDASYWVYLIHLPLTAIIPAFIWQFPFPAIIKFLIVLLATTFICFVTYHYFVRNTFIGKFLNGRKYPIKKR